MKKKFLQSYFRPTIASSFPSYALLIFCLAVLSHYAPILSGPTEIPDTIIRVNNKILHFFAPAICIGNACTCPLTSGMDLVFTGSYENHEFYACKVKR